MSLKRRRRVSYLRPYQHRFAILKNSNLEKMTITGLKELIDELEDIKKKCKKNKNIQKEILNFIDNINIEIDSRMIYKVRTA